MNTEELLAEIRKNLYRWYDYPENAEVSLYENLEKDRKYDVIISVADIEKTDDPGRILAECRASLKAGGRLLLAVNNRFGIKYFCGDKDPYTGRNFDGIENYARAYAKKEDGFNGRMYDRSQLSAMLENAGFVKYQFYSVLNDLENPCLIYREDFLPNEDLSNRIFPTYNDHDTVFLEEGMLYKSLIDNNMFHQMANAYIYECAAGDLSGDEKADPDKIVLSNIQHVTSSAERGPESALMTIIRDNGTVEKAALYEEGHDRLVKLYQYGEELKANGIKVVDAKLEKGRYIMPFVRLQSGQLYLKELLHSDKEKFLAAMDLFRDTILRSSEIISEDRHDGMGAVLKFGYMDLVPLNSFWNGSEFVFYDQEFRVDKLPANVLVWRMIATFFSGDMEAGRLISMDSLFDRYDLKKNLNKWQETEWKFLNELRNEDLLRQYHKEVRADGNVINANRQRMNYSEERYEKLFINIFEHADTRKLILFGSGNFTKRFLTIYGGDYDVYAIVDNSRDKWGQELEGIKICSPEIFKELGPAEYKVIVCIKNYLSVMKQLDEIGVGDYSIYDPGHNYARPLKPIAGAVSDEAGEKQAKKKYHIGYVAGAFDMFHVGHLNLLRRAKEQCDYLIVGVIADATIERKKDKKPIIPEQDRVDIVASCRYVDQAEVLPDSFNDIVDAYNMFHFDVQFSGNDHAEDEAWKRDREYLERQGADIVFFQYTEKVSSTKLREEIKG